MTGRETVVLGRERENTCGEKVWTIPWPTEAHITSKRADTRKRHPAVRILYPMVSFSPRRYLLISAGENQAVNQGWVHYSNQGSGEHELRGARVSMRASG